MAGSDRLGGDGLVLETLMEALARAPVTGELMGMVGGDAVIGARPATVNSANSLRLGYLLLRTEN